MKSGSPLNSSKGIRLQRNTEITRLSKLSRIRYCIAQAEEYWRAAGNATTATKPLQLYYGCMSLALAEVLWKGDGTYSIDKLRQQHSNHGLQFDYDRKTLLVSDLDSILAKPMITRAGRSGTFEVWHTHARELSIFGKISIKTDKRENVEIGSIMGAVDERMELLPEDGASLKTLYENTPRMATSLSALGLEVETIRVKVEMLLAGKELEPWNRLNTLYVYPNTEKRIAEFRRQIQLSKTDKTKIEFIETWNAFILRITDKNEKLEKGDYTSFPHGFSMSAGVTHFKINLPFLNEFGIYYMGSYLLGMLCRYFPDLWMKEIDRHSDFIHLAESFLSIVAQRAPLLTLGVLSDASYISNDIGLSL